MRSKMKISQKIIKIPAMMKMVLIKMEPKSNTSMKIISQHKIKVKRSRKIKMASKCKIFNNSQACMTRCLMTLLLIRLTNSNFHKAKAWPTLRLKWGISSRATSFIKKCLLHSISMVLELSKKMILKLLPRPWDGPRLKVSIKIHIFSFNFWSARFN